MLLSLVLNDFDAYYMYTICIEAIPVSMRNHIAVKDVYLYTGLCNAFFHRLAFIANTAVAMTTMHTAIRVSRRRVTRIKERKSSWKMRKEWDRRQDERGRSHETPTVWAQTVFMAYSVRASHWSRLVFFAFHVKARKDLNTTILSTVYCVCCLFYACEYTLSCSQRIRVSLSCNC